MSLLFKNYSLVEVTYLLIRFNNQLLDLKFFLSNKNNSDEIGVNKQNIHTHTKHMER